MPVFRHLPSRFLLPLAFAALGAVLCGWLIPAELRAIAEQLTGFPDSDVNAHMARPYVLAGLCFLPAIAALVYACGGTLDRHIARHFGNIFCICLASLLLIWMLVDFADNLKNFRKASNMLGTAATYYQVRSPAVVLLVLPYALLLALIYSLGKLSRDREIIAMVQSGRSLIRLTAPLIGAGIWCSLLCLGLNYQWAPTAEGRQGEILDAARGILITEAKHVIYNNPDQHRLWMIGAFPKNYEKGEPLLNVEVTTTRPDGALVSRLLAKRARWDLQDNSWTFEAPVICHFTDGEAPKFETPNPPEFHCGWTETPWQLIKPGLAAPFLGIPDLNGWLRANTTKHHTQPNKNAAAPYLTQWHYRWALPFTCLVTVLLAAPLSIYFSRRGPGGNLFLAIVLSALMIFSTGVFLNFGEAGLLHPALAAWLPNLVFSLLGLFLFHRRIADRSIYQSLRRLFTRATPPAPSPSWP
ncbi:MAG: YjgP/YjgQ family permease [Verrucomicrobia bacterium]|nr:MAG: YjgP/YjgQ family permease [Verrucomicrobiota bacterium]